MSFKRNLKENCIFNFVIFIRYLIKGDYISVKKGKDKALPAKVRFLFISVAVYFLFSC